MNERIIPGAKKPIPPNSSRFLYEEWMHLGQRLETEELTNDERKELHKRRAATFQAYEDASDREKDEPERIGAEYLQALRHAIKEKDLSLLRATIILVQEFVNRTNKDRDLEFIRFDDSELEKIIKGGTATILVGSGTHGQRIFISLNHLHMSGDQYGQEYRTRFAKLFGIKFELDQDLRVEL
jgi:hypothetical protein